jgi:MoaA/NifB/PqqE/SkfB family radical SAM enzyme
MKTNHLSRNKWRSVPAQAATHWFHPTAGLHAIEQSPTTQVNVAAAPRTVMFGITNGCNMTCDFCSREIEILSTWSVNEAAQLLCDLSERGVLEVAYGGGEPFVFKYFERLLATVYERSNLAQSITTNGTLIDAARAARIAPWVGQVRISVYDDNLWYNAAHALVEAGIQTGINVIVTPDRLAALPALLDQAAQIGCHDVALLRYVGVDHSMHLSSAQQTALSHIALLSPIPVKLSVCFGSQINVPLLESGDCGAGDSFISITADRHVRACSFHGQCDQVIHSADDVIDIWRAQQTYLHTPSERRGCARANATVTASMHALPAAPSLRIWQGFSGNNSGECVHVARFESIAKASDAVSVLTAGMKPGEIYSSALLDLFERLAIPINTYTEPANPGWQTMPPTALRSDFASAYPDQLVQAGHIVIATTDWALDDVFPEIRTYLWKQGGVATYVGTHVHDTIVIAAAFYSEHIDALRAICEAIERRSRTSAAAIHGKTVRVLMERSEQLADDIAWLESLSKQHNAAYSMELAPLNEMGEARPKLKLAALAGAAGGAGIASNADAASAQQGLFVWFSTKEYAQQFGRAVEDAAVFGCYAWIEGERIGPRLGYIAGRYRGLARWVCAPFSFSITWAIGKENKTDLDQHIAALKQCCRPFLKRPHDEIIVSQRYQSISATIETNTPALLMKAAIDSANNRSLKSHCWVDTTDIAVRALERVRVDAMQFHRLARGR